MSEDFDTELFINEVKKYPELWNVGVEEYKNRGRKDAAWENVARFMTQDYGGMSIAEKKAVVKKCVTRWKNIKDTYSKSVKKRTASGQPARKHRVYLYARQLSFLQTSRGVAETQSTIEEPDSEESSPATIDTPEQLLVQIEEEPSETSCPSTTSYAEYATPSQKKKKQRDLESSLLAYMREPIAEKLPDDHKYFFESLLPIVRKFNDEQTLEFRTEVLKLATRIRRQGLLPPDPPFTDSASRFAADRAC